MCMYFLSYVRYLCGRDLNYCALHRSSVPTWLIQLLDMEQLTVKQETKASGTDILLFS